jgi:hypothetical protein
MKQYINKEYRLSTFEELSAAEKISVVERHVEAFSASLKIKENLGQLRSGLKIADSVRNRYDLESKSYFAISQAELLKDLSFFANVYNTLNQQKRYNSSLETKTLNQLKDLINNLRVIRSNIGGISQSNLHEYKNIRITFSDAKIFLA